MAVVTRKCKYCREPFLARQADINRGWAKFCSKSCKAKEQEKRTHQYASYKDRQEDREYDEAMSAVEWGWDGHKNWL
jgi:hypothetical protein